MTTWTFITNHGSVLALIAEHKEITAREISTRLNITERSVHRIISDLETEGYITKRKVGRNNHYSVRRKRPLRLADPLDAPIGDLLNILTPDSDGG